LDTENSWVSALSKAGYDVWLGNNRGCIYSRGHTNLTANDAAYFDFSFYEMGQYDLPATIDYIREITDQEKISYIGHS
jgi:lysosomal acid lipase/cholesteryl ester hydrolase